MKTKLLLLLAFICQISFAQVSDANLVAYYSFDNTLVNAGPGGSNYNLSYFGTGTNPTYLATGGVTGGSINNPGCFEFNTTITLQNSEFFNLLASTNPNQSISVSYWVYNNQAQGINSIRTHFEMFGSLFARGGLGWGVSTQNGNFNTTADNIAFTSGVWNHITLVFDASVRRLRMYVNGFAYSEVVTPANSIFKYNNKFVIGGGTDGSGENSLTKALSGRIDEMYVFNRALRAFEVIELYNKQVPTNNCPTGSYSATTQAQVDALAGCTTINGDLTINAPNVTYLNSLSSLTTVNGNLTIANCTNLTNLEGLSNLTTVTGNLVIGGTSISNLNPLTSLTTFNSIVLNGNNSLTDIQTLSNISGSLTGNITIINNQNLTNLNGLQNITQATNLNISNNASLQSINGLSGLTTLTNSFSNTLTIENNPLLVSLNGLNNLVNLPNNGGVRIISNTSLTDIDALATISNLAYLEITNNTNLSTCAIAPVCNLLNVNNSNAFISGNGANCSSKTVVQNICATLANPCPPGNVTFLTQAEVNAFVAQYPNCTEINGLLTINGGNISNLSGLSNITSITNGLTISQCNTLASLNGLQNITSINGNISISNNPLLVDLTGLNGLTSLNNNSSGSLGNIFLNQNNSLTSLNGLQNLTTLTKENLMNTRTGFAIFNCNNLTDISALGNINNAVVEYIVISNNTSLNNCAIATVCNKLAVDSNWVTISGNATGCESVAIVQATCNPDPCPTGNVTLTTQAEVSNFLAQYPNCTQINGNLTIDGWDVTNLSSLGNLTSITGDMNLYNVNSSASLTGLQNITTVGGRVYIEFQRPNVDYLSGLTSVGGLVVAGAGITNLNGLSNITGHIPGNLEVFGNPMTNLTGLNNITSVGNDLLIVFSNNLVDLTGLNNINSVGKSLTIHFNNNLTSLNGLNNLTTIGDIDLNNSGFSLRGNPLLTNISALENVTNIVRGFNLWDNASLTNCAIAPVCNKLANSTTNITLTGNATGCESIAVVQAACDTLSSSDFELESNLKIYPNPFNSQITFDFGNSYENVTVIIHDITGKQLYKNSFSGNQLVVNNLGNLPSGIYVATLTTENGTSITKKIVK